MKPSDFNYFASEEKALLRYLAEVRTRLARPFCRLCTAVGCTPDMLSLAGLLALAPFVLLEVWGMHWLAIACIVVSQFLDGLDGPLARYQGVDDVSGSLTDMVCDQTGLAVVVCTLIYTGLSGGALGALYLYLYTVMVVFLVLRNVLGRPYRYVLRSRYMVFFAYLLYAASGINVLNPVLILCSLYMLVVVLRGYVVLRKSLKA